MRESGTPSCWSGSKGSSVSPVHLTQERCLMPFPVSHLRLLSHSDWYHSLVQSTQSSSGRKGKVKAFPHDSLAHLMPAAKVVSQKGWIHPLLTATSLWPLSSFTQPGQERDAGPVSASPNQPSLTPSPVTNSHRLSSEQPSTLDPYSTSLLWKPKLPALLPLRQGWRTGNSCCRNEGC